MVWLYHAPIALVTLLLCPTVFSIPHQRDQMVFETSGPVRTSASNVIMGDNIPSLLHNMANELDRGLPGGWERLVQPPQTSGTSGIEVFYPQYLDQVLNGWGLDEEIRAQAFEDVKLLIMMHAQDAVYVSQRFTYNKPNCQGGGLHVCMFTLIAVARQIIESEESYTIELGHIYIQSFSTAIQQMSSYHYCHRCWLRKCCHDRYYPRDFSVEELNDIQAVLSTNQAWWAYGNIPEAPVEMANTLDTHSLPLKELLQQFVNNKEENKDVFKKYDGSLLGAIRNSTRSSRRHARSMSMSLKEGDLLVFLDTLLSPCFRKAKVNETVQELWRRLYDSHHDGPLSLECETISQRREILDPPMKGCNRSSIVTTDTKYSWFLISPRTDLFDCIYINNDVEGSHFECEQLPDDRDDSSNDSLRHYLNSNDTSSESEGSVVRWSVLNRGGSFFPIHYLVQWALYPIEVNKAITDIMRYASGTAYLRIPLPQFSPSSEIQDLALIQSDINLQGVSDALTSLGNSLVAFATGWENIVKAFKTTVTETVRRKVCLGFARYEHAVSAIFAEGIDEDHLPKVVDSLLKIAKVPDNEYLRDAMLLIQLSSNFTWTEDTASYTSYDGFHNFLYFFKHANELTRKIDIAFGVLKSDFTLAPDVLIVNKKKSIAGGIFETEETFHRNVPHTITLNDTVLLDMYFEITAYRKLAMVTRLPVPNYPNLDFLCDFRSV